MIFDSLKHLDPYVSVHPRFAAAFKFLQETRLSELATGKYEIDGDRVFAIVDRAQGRPRESAPLEAHRKYIDIQVVVTGSDEMGWKNLENCRDESKPYKPENDILFFADTPDAWIQVKAGHFAIFFPNDAHAPLVGAGEIFKIVIKVLFS